MLGPGSIKRYGLVGGSVVIVRVGLETLLLAACKLVFSCMPFDEDIEFPVPPVPFLPGHCNVPTLMIMD